VTKPAISLRQTGLLERLRAREPVQNSSALRAQARAAKELVRAVLGEQGWVQFWRLIWEEDIRDVLVITLGPPREGAVSPAPSPPPPIVAAPAIKRKLRSGKDQNNSN